jgi:hypothetical protein
MATFDPDRGKLIAYGGNTDFSDLWEVDVATGLRTDRTTCAYVNVFANWGDALAYDAGRKRVVRFPYSGASNVREWDPVTNVWTNRPAPSGSAVPDGYGRVAVFDTNRALMIVFITTTSGAISVWEWNGTTGGWTQRQASFPTMFSYGLSSLAFDPGRNVLWGFGGVPNSFPISSSDRLWTWNVATTELVDLTPATRPAAWPVARSGAGLAYDVLRNKVMLYGGSVGSFSRRDFWEWNPAAATWTDLTPSGLSPSGGDTPGIVWPPIDSLGEYHLFADPARGRLVLLHTNNLMAVGHSGAWLWDAARSTWSEPKVDTAPALWPNNIGVSASTTWDDDDGAIFLASYGELWRWTASDGVWTALAWRGGMGAPNSLPHIDGAAIAYDPKARKIVLFGGELAFTGGTPAMLVNDLRLWDPATSQLSIVSRPAGAAWPEPRRNHAMAYDPVRQRVLMFGGSKPEPSRELWELDTASGTWRDLSGAAAGAAWPEARMGHSMALDPERRVFVLKGGGDTSWANPTAALDATWELTAGTASWSKRAAPSPEGPFGVPLAFVSGVGLLTVGPRTGAADGFELRRWDGTAGTWTPLVDLPPATWMTPPYFGGFVGARNHAVLLWVPVGDTTVAGEDRLFYRLSQWGPTP